MIDWRSNSDRDNEAAWLRKVKRKRREKILLDWTVGSSLKNINILSTTKMKNSNHSGLKKMNSKLNRRSAWPNSAKINTWRELAKLSYSMKRELWLKKTKIVSNWKWFKFQCQHSKVFKRQMKSPKALLNAIKKDNRSLRTPS